MPGLLGPRDPAQPLLTLLVGPARVELSGGTTANWLAKTANLLVDGYGAPGRVGLLLPLHWQPVCLLLGAAATGATVVLVSEPALLAGCAVAFTTAQAAPAALAAGVDDVLVVSGHPMGAPVESVPPGAVDAALEIPAYGDRFAGPEVPDPEIEVDGRGLGTVPDLGLTGTDRLLTCLPLVGGLGVLLAALGAGASLVLVPSTADVDVVRAGRAERITATAGLDLPGVRRVG